MGQRAVKSRKRDKLRSRIGTLLRLKQFFLTFSVFISVMTMPRSPLILVVMLIASSLAVDAQLKNRDRNFDDFRGQSFCKKRQRGPADECCADRIDECSVPIAGKTRLTLNCSRHSSWTVFQVLCAIVMSSVISISTQIAVLTMRVYAEVCRAIRLESVVKSVTISTWIASKKQKLTATYGKSFTFFIVTNFDFMTILTVNAELTDLLSAKKILACLMTIWSAALTAKPAAWDGRHTTIQSSMVASYKKVWLIVWVHSSRALR